MEDPGAMASAAIFGSMSTGLEKLISIDFSHGYCAAPDGHASYGAFTGIRIRPTPETARRLALYSFLLRTRSGGLDLFISPGQREALEKVAETLDSRETKEALDRALLRLFWPPLLFTLDVLDPLFFNYTDVPIGMGRGQPALWLSNARATEAPGGHAVAASWRKPNLHYAAEPPPSPPAPAEASGSKSPAATETGRPERPSPAVRPMTGDQGFSQSRGDFSKAMAERRAYRRNAGEGQLLGFFEVHIAPPVQAADAAVARSAFPLEGTVGKASGGGVEFSEIRVQHLRFDLRFEARATQWRYFVAGRGKRPLDRDSLRIVDPVCPDEAAPGWTSREFELPDGSPAICFSSTDLRPLRRRPARGLALSGPPATGALHPRLLVPSLPAPSADILQAPDVPPHATSPPTPCSDVYLYV
jgi:hypothetical protein